MFKLRSILQLIRHAGVALVLAASLALVVLPTVAMAAPLEGQYGHGGYGGCANGYVVRKGDTLSGIASRYGVSLWSLREANGIGNIDHIYAGQYLCIVGGYQGGYHNGYQGGHNGGHNGYQGGHQGHYSGRH